MRIVAALGGNALLERGETPDAVIQQRHVKRAAGALVPLAAAHELIVCHGNGPQIGLLALESSADPLLTQPYPLDALGAQTQGLIGYWLCQELHNAGVAAPVVSIVTQTVVAADDPAFQKPAKFIGPVYPRREAQRLARSRGWSFEVDGSAWRRVVASPEPQRIVELAAIRTLAASGAVVVCGGGGGAPVARDEAGTVTGVEAVVDKDAVAALLGIALDADALVLLTDVPAVMRGFGAPGAEPITAIGVDDLAGMTFPAGSMGPKVEACVRFVRTTGRAAHIGALGDATAVLAGRAGTTISPTR